MHARRPHHTKKCPGRFTPGVLGATPSCKRSASIGLPRRGQRVPPKCTAAAENWLGACISAEYGGTRVPLFEAAHNPEVAGSNLPPLFESPSKQGARESRLALVIRPWACPEREGGGGSARGRDARPPRI